MTGGSESKFTQMLMLIQGEDTRQNSLEYKAAEGNMAIMKEKNEDAQWLFRSSWRYKVI